MDPCRFLVMLNDNDRTLDVESIQIQDTVAIVSERV